MKSTLYSLIANVLRLPVDGIHAELAMANTPSWDSLSHMDLIVSVEEHFGINLEADEIVQMTSVGEIERILNGKGVLAA